MTAMTLRTLFSIGLFAFLSCQDNGIPFDKDIWNEDVDGKTCSPLREHMLKDLLSNHKLKGLSYRQMVEKIGPADMHPLGTKPLVRYELSEDYTFGDIVHVKTLDFYLTKDSIIDSWKIEYYDVDL
jgi:hypothetical protein